VDPAPVPTSWQTATVLSVTDETRRAKTFRLRLERPIAHMAGQHYVIRLTAPDGYTASRSYSIASAPDEEPDIELTVERLEGGEVSTFLHDVVQPGDELDVRGPIGGWFVWDATTPALLIGGGSGVVPLMAMLRFARRRNRTELLRLVVSVRSPEDLYYATEIRGAETNVIYTRTAPSGELRPPGHLTAADLPAAPGDGCIAYVCGSAGFANAATDLLIASGMPAADIRVERFGPTS
jgi:ferredoxin-NADP reductase